MRALEDRTPQLLSVYEQYLVPRQTQPDTKGFRFDSEVNKDDLQAILQHNPKFYASWNGSRPNGNESADDLSLMNHLAYYFNGDPLIMKEFFLSSPHYKQKDNAHKEKCAREDYLQRTIKVAIEGLAKNSRGSPPEKNTEIQPVSTSPPSPSSIEPFAAISAIDLYYKAIPEQKFYVDKLLPQGLTLLTAPPKYGKSWFCYDLVISVAAGRPFLGQATRKSETLYLALEDGERRLQERLRLILPNQPPPDGIHIVRVAKTVDQGLSEQVADYMAKYPNIGAVVIDVLERVRSNKSAKNRSAYSLDYCDMTALKAIADKHDVAVLVVHHDRKAKDESDYFNKISGTNGIMGAADTVMLITKEKRSDGSAILRLTGRDIEEANIVIKLDLKDTFRWNVVGTLEQVNAAIERAEYEADPVVKAIKKLLSASPSGLEITAGRLADQISYYKDVPHADVKVGKAISKWKGFFEEDNIIHKKGDSKGKLHSFRYKTCVEDNNAPATTDTNEQPDTPATPDTIVNMPTVIDIVETAAKTSAVEKHNHNKDVPATPDTPDTNATPATPDTSTVEDTHNKINQCPGIVPFNHNDIPDFT